MLGKSARINHRGAGGAVACSLFILVVCLCLFCLAQPARAAVVWSGDVDPDDPTTWDENTIAHIGKNSSGTLDITGGSDVLGNYSYIGYGSGSTGEVTVDGIGSTWTTSEYLYIGRSGSGSLNITGGGVVSNGIGNIGENAGSTGTVTVDGSGSTWRNNGSLKVGDGGNGTLNITDGGTLINGHGYIGHNSGSTGEVAVDGVGSMWTNRGNLNVGWHGNGTLNITDGAAVSVSYSCTISYYPGSTGEVTVDGASSTLAINGGLVVGDKTGNGTVNITDGGAISSGFSFIGFESNSTGAVAVDGAGSTWTNRGFLTVSHSGSGTLNITNGGAVSNGIGYIGENAGSTGTVTVDDNDSTWTSNGSLHVGRYGSGTLNITDGGVVSNGIGYIGENAGSTGTVTVDDAGSTWTNSGSLTVGRYGNGTLNITDGGAVSSGSYGWIGVASGSTGEVMVDGAGSTLTYRYELEVGRRGGSGTLNITDGGAVSSDGGYIGYYSSSTGQVTVDGAGSVWANNGWLRIGAWGNGTLNITGGGLVSVAGGLTIEHYADSDSFINMASGGMLALFGDADDSLVDFLELVDGTDAIRYWDDSILDWADITGATYGDDYTLSYLTEGDLDGYTVLTVGVVPEPGTITLLSMGVLGLLLFFRRR